MEIDYISWYFGIGFVLFTLVVLFPGKDPDKVDENLPIIFIMFCFMWGVLPLLAIPAGYIWCLKQIRRKINGN